MMTTPDFTPQATFRLGKYVLAYDDLRPKWQAGCAAPREWCTVPELLERDGTCATRVEVEPRKGLPEFRFDYRGDDPNYLGGVMPPQDVPATYILKIPRGRTFGRHGIVHVPTADASLKEFDYGSGSLAIMRDVLPGGRWNPQYWKHAALWLLQRRRLPSVLRCPGKVAVLNAPGSHNFFHWMCEILPRLWTLWQSGERADWYLIDHCQGFHRRTLQALGVPAERIIQPHSTLHLEADELLVPSKFFPNACREVGARLAEQLRADDAPETPSRVFINRRKSRRAANETAFAAWRRRHGFVDYFLEDLPLPHQFALFRRAKVVLGMHGAGLTHLMHCRPGTQVLELMPVGKLQLCYPTLSRLAPLSHALVSVPRVGWGQDMNVPLKVMEDLATAWGTSSQRQAA